MHQPKDFIVQDKKKDHVCLLKKSLIGLKKSLKKRHKRFIEWFEKDTF
jgi:hypothetical protein